MRVRTFLKATTALLSTGAVLLPAAAMAQSAQADSESALEEVVVTAERYTSTVQTTPVAVSALSETMLQERQIIDVRQLTSQVPGIVITPATGTSTAARIVLRGAGQEQSGINFDPAVGIYIDNVYQPRINGAFFDFFDIDRIEVLRGPQGTLYGRNTSGGAIKIQTRKPSFEWTWAGDVALGNYERTDVRGVVSGPIMDDTLAFSLSAVSRKRGGFIDAPAYGRKVNNRDTQAVRGKLLFTPNERTEIEAALDYQQDRSDPGIGVPLQVGVGVNDPFAVPNRRLTRTELFGPMSNKLFSIGGAVNASYEVSDQLTINSITGYRNLRALQSAPFWLTAAAVNSGNGALNIGSTTKIKDEFFSEEVNATFQTERLKGVVGLYYFDENGLSQQFQPYSTPNDQNRDTKAIAAFGQVTWEIVDGLGLTAGLRRTREKANFTQFYYTQRNFSQSDEKVFKGWSPKIAVDWQPNDDLLAYVSYTRGFKSGGFNPVPPNTNTGVGGATGAPTPYGEEKVDSYEGGVKYTTPNRRARINVAVFKAKYKGLQLPVFFPGTNNSYTSNASDATVRGLEIEPTWQVTDALQLYAIMAFTRGKYTAPFNCSRANTQIVDCSDRKIKGVIPAKIIGGLTFEPELNIPGQLRLAADADYTDSYFNNVANEGPLVQTKEVTLVNASIAWDTPDGHWTVILEGRNIFNKHHVLAGLQLASPAIPSVTGFINEPRLYDIRIRTKF
jgi:iron complex outermembrane recepter protein